MRVFLALVVLCAAARVEAHPAPFSYLDLHIDSDRMHGSLVLHVVDVAHELGIGDAGVLLEAAAARHHRDRIVGLVEPRLRLSGDDTPLQLEWGEVEPEPERHAIRLAFRINQPPAGRVEVRARLFPYDPVHQTFINVYESGRLRQQSVIGGGGGSSVFYRGTAQGALAVVGTFLPSGIHHILIGPDHILFLVGLLLLGGGPWALVRIVTAFTVGHSITLSLAALGIVTPPADIVEPAIALSIVFVGADNLLVGSGGRDVRAWIALVFGLVHGFGFAGVLREFGLPPEALGWSLFSFNLGVEIGQLLIVLAIAGALAAVRRRDQRMARWLVVAGSVVVMAAGGYWFVERVFFAQA